MALLPQLRAAPSTYGRTFSDRTAASKLLAMLQQTFEAEKEFATVDKEIARVQGTGFDSRGCYKTLLQINPELRGFNEKYKNDFHIEIVCAHPTPKCTTVALKQSGKPLKYLELCEMATDSGEYTYVCIAKISPLDCNLCMEIHACICHFYTITIFILPF